MIQAAADLDRKYIVFNFTFTGENAMSHTTIMDVQSYIDEQRFMHYQWLILLLGIRIVAVDGSDTASF